MQAGWGTFETRTARSRRLSTNDPVSISLRLVFGQPPDTEGSVFGDWPFHTCSLDSRRTGPESGPVGSGLGDVIHADQRVSGKVRNGPGDSRDAKVTARG